MKREYSAHRLSWLAVTTMLALLGAAACSPDGAGESGGTDEGSATGARLSTGAAGDLLSNGFSPSEPASEAALALGRTAPTGPTDAQMTVDSLGVDFGTIEAPVRIIEFFDYGCGFCRSFHQETRSPLLEEYVAQGQVFWKSVPFIIGRWPASVPISLAAECARDQGRDYFEAISTLIFQDQSEWKSASSPEDLAEGYAREVGLDMPRFQGCFENDELLWRLQAQTSFAQDLGVRATPTFYVAGIGTIPGALPLETFRQVIDTVLVQVAAAQLDQ